MAITNKDINLVQLDKETGGKGLIANFSDASKKIILPANHNLLTDAELEKAIDAHIPNDYIFSVSEKLSSLGLSINDIKAALGLA